MMLKKDREVNYLAQGFLGLNPITKLKQEHFKERDRLRAIQLKIQDNDYTIVGYFNHKDLIKNILKKKGIVYNTLPDEKGNAPSEKGLNYELIGAGFVTSESYILKNGWSKLKFFGGCEVYDKFSINKKSLENTFGKERVMEYNNTTNLPFYFVDYKFDNEE